MSRALTNRREWKSCVAPILHDATVRWRRSRLRLSKPNDPLAALGAVADAVYLVRSGLNRHEVAREGGANVSLAVELASEREDRLVTGSTAAPEPESLIVREERLHEAATERRHENDELAELFLHGGAERIAAEPRLANALQAQVAMDQHLGAAFDGDADRMASASVESRHMISDVLRRGLDVSVREPTPVRQVEPIRPPHDLER